MAGIYIHIPFCRKACTYCNFHFSTGTALIQSTLEAIKQEIKTAEVPNKKIATIYIGGGTPSLLAAEQIAGILAIIKNKFVVSPDAEITIEANPDDINEEKLHKWINVGINRLSVGIQSFDEAELTWMNRAHTAVDAKNCLSLIRRAGINNFSIDLIYGSPFMTVEKLKSHIAIIKEFSVPHLSCYALTVESGTALHHNIYKKNTAPLNEEDQSTQFLELMYLLNDLGYEHYEISNFALPGFRSKHNSSYWNGDLYYGYGPSAHSYFNGSRRWNVANNQQYITGINENKPVFEEELLTPVQKVNEYIMVALRTKEGINLNKIDENFPVISRADIISKCNRYISTGKVQKINEALVLTTEGKLYADGIAADLFF